jgi:hypothetical protein
MTNAMLIVKVHRIRASATSTSRVTLTPSDSGEPYAKRDVP